METVEKSTVLGVDDFKYICAELLKRGFRGIDGRQKYEDFYRYGITRTKPVNVHTKESETGFIYVHPSGLKTKVWTSFIEAGQKFRESDYGYVLIENEHGHVVYWAQLSRRTKNFAYNLVMRARMALERTMYRQICDDKKCGCRSWMHIIELSTGAYMWACVNDAFHGGRKKCPTRSIDVSLSEEVLAFAQKKRIERKRDRKDPRRLTPRSRRGFGNKQPNWRKTYQPQA